jgi:hypothetical protein
MKTQLTSKDVAELLASVRELLHPVAYETVDGLLRVGELKVAVEFLCEFVSEDRLVLDASSYQKLMDIIAWLEVDERYRAAVPAPART